MEDNKLVCGWKGYSPNWLQRFATINWFLVFLSMFSTLQGMLVNGVVSASLPHLEKEFGLKSTHSGMIMASNDISGLLFVLIVSFYGGTGHKPKWLGWGAIVTGMGSFLFALPKLIKGKYVSGTVSVRFQDFETCNINGTVGSINESSCIAEHSSGIYLAIFCIAEMIMGLGTTPLYTLGAAYLDENVSPKNSPIYIGIWYMTTFLGPSVGFFIGGALLNQYVDLGKVPDYMHPNHPLWVGRWWFPFTVFSWFLCLSGIVLLLFPRSIPGAAAIREKAIANRDILATEKQLEKETGLKGFLKATMNLITNKILVMVCFAMAARVLVSSGLATFISKFTVIKFGANPSESNFYIGILLVAGTSFGLAAGSIVMRQLKIKGSVRVAIILCAVLALMGVGTSFTFLMPGCKTLKLAGINSGYPSSVTQDVTQLNTCNKNCSCIKEFYHPVCSNGVTYFSPCYAGCTNETSSSKIYKDCNCLSTNDSSTQNFVTAGKCDQYCENLVLYIVLTFCILVLSFAKGTPNNMIVLRSVPDNQRSFAMGFHFLILRSLAMLPGPVFLGNVIDSTCLVWKIDECGKKANCIEYDIDKLSRRLTGALAIGAGASFVFYMMALKFYKEPSKEVINFENDGYASETTKL